MESITTYHVSAFSDSHELTLPFPMREGGKIQSLSPSSSNSHFGNFARAIKNISQ
jgi:hypothetical protein